MKRLSILLALLVCAATNVVAQYRNFHEGDFIQADSVIFEVSYALNKTMYLTNTANQFDDEWISWADGQPISENDYQNLTLGVIDKSSVNKAIRQTFSESEYAQLEAGEDRVEVLLTFSSGGKILELSLFVALSPRTRNLTPQQYANLENNLKKYLYTTITPDMAKLSFWRSFLVLNFAKLSVKYRDLNPGVVLPDSLQINP